MEIAQACNKSRYRSMISLERIAVCKRKRGTDKKETERERERERARARTGSLVGGRTGEEEGGPLTTIATYTAVLKRAFAVGTLL